MFKDKKNLAGGGGYKRGIFYRKIAVSAVSVVLFALFLAPAYAETAETKVADPETYSSYANADTEDAIGQVWTDKSVYTEDVTLQNQAIQKGNSDFLVALSALSSTSNEIVRTTKPLDIVLVLDVSGSMDNELQSAKYKTVYANALNEDNTYYVLNGANGYQEVKYYESVHGESQPEAGWYVDNGWWTSPRYVQQIPRTSADDTQENHVQFYVAQVGGATKKIDALKTAVNHFVDITAAENSSLPEDLKHQIALVKFAGKKTDKIGDDTYRDIPIIGTEYNYTQIIHKLAVVDEAYVSRFKSESSEVKAAGATSSDYGMEHVQTVLKDARPGAQKVVIFFTDGEPTHSSKFDSKVANDAIATAKSIKDAGALIYTIGILDGADPSDTISNFNAYMHGISSNYPKATAYTQLEDRAENSNYYQSADTAEKLDYIFGEIGYQISETKYALPVKDDPGSLDAGEYVTFTDTLGAYMQVDGFKSIVVQGKQFSNPTTSDPDVQGNVVYTFEGDNAGNILSPKSNVNKVIITVKPSNDCATGDTVVVKIPGSLLPLSAYTFNKGSETIARKATPISVVYGVSLKDCARQALAGQNSEVYAGMKSYLASHTTEDGNVCFYSGTFDENADAGKTTAAFTPIKDNTYYNHPDGSDFVKDPQTKTKNPTATAANAGVFTAGKTNLGNNGRLSIPHPTGNLVISKTVVIPEGLTPTADEFTFTVHVDGAAGDFAAGNGTITFDESGDATVTLKDGKSITIKGLPANAAYSVTETVPDGFSAEMSGSGTIPFNNTAEVTCTNTYSVAPYTTGTDDGLAATKTLVGKALTNGEFSFKVEPQKSAPWPAGLSSDNNTVTNSADGSVTFGAVTFAEPNTYTYKVSEVNAGHIGYTYDDAVYIVTYEVTDNGQGRLVATRTITKNEASVDGITFVNTYKAEPITAASCGGTKSIEVKAGDFTLDAGEFTFKIEAQNNAPAPDLNTATNDAEGKYAFSPVTFTEPGVYKYVVSEVAPDPSIPGISCDDTRYTVAYTVGDQNGKLAVTDIKVEDSEGAPCAATEMNFTNSYDPGTVAYGISGTKILQVPAASERTLVDDEFSFMLQDENGSTLETVTNKGNAFAFTPITYSNVGTYTYTVHEVSGDDSTIDYDTQAYTIIVAVTDEDGKLAASASVANANENAVTFTNTYTPTPVIVGPNGSVAIQGIKTLEGAQISDAQFAFELKDGQGNVICSVQNDAQGAFVFPDITYTEAGIYRYTVSEVNAGQTIKGVTYDTAVYGVTVTVAEDAANHKLTADVAYQTENKPAFVNTYKAAPVTLALGAQKQLEGAALKDGQFTFLLKDATGNVVSEATNTADGKITFDAITFDEEGEYAYTVSEVQGDQQYITYDDTVYPMAIKVTDVDGQLVAQISDAASANAVFVNICKEPEPQPTPLPVPPVTGDPQPAPLPATPVTGDPLPVAALLISAVTALVILTVAGAVVRRSNKRH